MTKFTWKLFVISIAFLINGCTSVQPVSPNTSPITLDQPCTRKAELGIFGMVSVVFPAGMYRPDFQTEKGVYYVSPTFVFINGHPYTDGGGLFIPKSSNEKQALWMVQDWGGNSAYRYDLNEAITYH